MSEAFASAVGGRAASFARRRALSAGKAALPPARERTGAGRGQAAPPPAVVAANTRPSGPAAEAVPVANNAPTIPLASNGSLSGRLLSIQRRHQLSAGKIAGNGVAQKPQAAPAAAPAPVNGASSAREEARLRRAELSRRGRGDLPPAAPARIARQGTIIPAPPAAPMPTSAGASYVTGLRLTSKSTITGGDQRGPALSVNPGKKVGFSRTQGGLTVSGTLVRSAVRVTGDEAGSVEITGEADQRIADDLTPRADDRPASAAQFRRQAEPHGASVHGTNLGRSLRSAGSRERLRQAAIESTAGGLPVTGSALGRSVRITGDEAGSCRRVTGDQYLSPAESQSECGGTGGGTAPAAHIGAQRRDPVTGAKVRIAQTWTGRRVTGIDVEHDPRVTGDEPGSCRTITGSTYQGAGTIDAWCDDDAAAEARARLAPRVATTAVTGDIPRDAAGVTGTARGATRSITGTPYYTPDIEAAAPTEPVAAIDEHFSIRSPQRAAHLRANGNGRSRQITGSFASGGDKVTGNLEFVFRSRSVAKGEATASRTKLTGEGTPGRRITGDSWSDNAKVGGTESWIAVERNPSERGGKPKPFAGAGRFKALASAEEPKHLVTGMFGYSSDTGAKVTLSGGAQG
jgi:hypothetical protein